MKVQAKRVGDKVQVVAAGKTKSVTYHILGEEELELLLN